MSQADRDSQSRTPIADSVAGKPWVLRYKDLRGWWSNLHYDRPGGAESVTPTAWTPQSKPIWFVEVGCPAVDKGANQPNVFVDPKSSESVLPHYSSGARDDLIQRRALEALLGYWTPEAGLNPVSSVYGEPMLAIDRAHVWTWDARPFPDFPARTELWGDGANWRLGHWLTGRVGLASLAEVVADIAGRVDEDVDVSALEGLVTGFVIDRPMSVRAALEPLARLYHFSAVERGGALAFQPSASEAAQALHLDHVVLDEAGRRIVRSSDDVSTRPREARLRFFDEARDYRVASSSAREAGSAPSPVIDVSVPAVLDAGAAQQCARAWLADAQAGSEAARVRLPPSMLALEAGDVVEAAGRAYRIERIEEGEWRELELRAVSTAHRIVAAGAETGTASAAVVQPATPYGVVLDIPLLPGETDRGGPRVAIAADPWPGAVTVGAGVDLSGMTERARALRSCAVGELLWDLHPGPVGRWDRGNFVRIRLVGGSLPSASERDVLNGANALAVELPDGEWEILQFREATLVAPETYEIRGLLRGLLGAEAGAVTAAGARVVSLANAATYAAPLQAHERGSPLAWRFSPFGRPFADATSGALSAVHHGRDLRPLAPVHLRVRRSGSDLLFSWRRRTRIGGDDWTSLDVPLGEAEERYRFDLLASGAVVLTREVTTAEAVVTAAEEAALPGGPHSSFEIEVAQISTAYGPGAVRHAVVHL